MKIDENTAKEIARLREVYEQRYEAMRQAEKQLETFALDFMDNNGMMSNPEDVMEMIEHLPRGGFQFRMYSTYFKMRETQEQ